jgi:hypothetical protein
VIAVRIRARVAIGPHQYECEAPLVRDYVRTISLYWVVVVASDEVASLDDAVSVGTIARAWAGSMITVFVEVAAFAEAVKGRRLAETQQH